MTASILQTELTNLIQDAKKRFPDVRNAAEASLGQIRALKITSESQLAGDLLRKADFIDPFLKACYTQTPKLILSGVISIQRLSTSRAINSERLKDVLLAFRAALASTSDVQLRVLQTFPSLAHLRDEDGNDEHLRAMLEICGSLQNSKTSVIASTATATFQQLVTTVFDRADAELQASSPGDEKASDRSRSPVEVSTAVSLFGDLCKLVGDNEPEFIKVSRMQTAFLLEMIENLLYNYQVLFLSDERLAQTCINSLLPACISLFTAKSSFNVATRSLRIFASLLRRQPEQIHDGFQTALSSIVSVLENNGHPAWKRALCMEYFRAVLSDPLLFIRIYSASDLSQCASQAGLLARLTSLFVRVAAEDPILIGLGRHSTAPARPDHASKPNNELLLDSSGLGGVVGGVASASTETTGLSVEWSTLQMPLIEQAERGAAPEVPTTYLYALVLETIVGMADSLSKLIMPLSVPAKGKRLRKTIPEDDQVQSPEAGTDADATTSRPSNKHHRFQNPLRLKDHSLHESVTAYAEFVKTCWPALLATCSTFLSSALDSIYYHGLIRALQKLTQVSGILELITPRDAFLTSLAKGATPVASPMRTTNNDDMRLETPKSPLPRRSLDVGQPILSIRNLLCVRALLNLGIALGPSLSSEAWTIILQSLQQAETAVSASTLDMTVQETTAKTVENGVEEAHSSVAAEVNAVRTASRKLFQNTSTYDDDAFSVLVTALFAFLGTVTESLADEVSSALPGRSNGTENAVTEHRKHQAKRSMSGFFKTSRYHDEEILFVLQTAEAVAKSNIGRFVSVSSAQVSWDAMIPPLLRIIARPALGMNLRANASDLVCAITVGSASSLDYETADQDELDSIHTRCLSALHAQIRCLDTGDEEDYLLHQKVLQALEQVLGHMGEHLKNGWKLVFQLLRQSFLDESLRGDELEVTSTDSRLFTPKSPELLRAAFKCVQLVASDFMTSLSPGALSHFSTVLMLFGLQLTDTNISLTVVSILARASSLVGDHVDDFIEKREVVETISELDMIKLSEPKSQTALWTQTIGYLNMMLHDQREEVRSSSIRVLFKVLDAYNAHIQPDTWICLLSLTVTNNIGLLLSMLFASPANSSSWENTISQLLEHGSLTTASHAEAICKAKSFSHFWRGLLQADALLLEYLSPKLWTATLGSLQKILHASSNVEFARSVLDVWYTSHPYQLDELEGGNSVLLTNPNQETFLQHTLLGVEAMRIIQATMTRKAALEVIDLTAILGQLHKTVRHCRHSPYTFDVKKVSPEQEQVLTILYMLRGSTPDDLEDLVEQLLINIQAPLNFSPESKSTLSASVPGSKAFRWPTYLAFSSRCIDLLDQVVTEVSPQSNAFASLLPNESLGALTRVIETQYSLLPREETDSAWQKASRVANKMIAVATNTLHSLRSSAVLEKLNDFIVAATAVAGAILSAPDIPSKIDSIEPTQIAADETVDIESFQTLHRLIIQSLGDKELSDTIRRSYILTVFHASLVAEPFLFDFPDDLIHHPLHDLQTIRHGTVLPPQIFPRQEIPYAALAAIIELVSSSHENTQQTLVIARTAAPYFLLRIVHSFKSYMADQKLRGLAPLPEPLQRELLYLLRRCVEMRVDDRAFHDVRSTDEKKVSEWTDGKSHLRLLYPIFRELRREWRMTWRRAGVNGGVTTTAMSLGMASRTSNKRGLKTDESAETSEDQRQEIIWAWQDREMGRGIERYIEEWEEAVTEGWGGGVFG